MISVRSAELLISLMTFFLAYLAAVTVAGAFRAWVAKKMGDDTAEYVGLLTLNPFAHIDLIGLVFLFLFYFGWGRYVPINPANISHPGRRAKLVLAYFADTAAYFVSALFGIVILIVTVGPQMFIVSQRMLVSIQHMSHLYLVSIFPGLSSLTVTLSFIVIAFVYLNVVLGVLSIILNLFSLIMYFIMERSTRYTTYNYYFIILIPIIMIFLFSVPLRLISIQVISYVGYGISRALGLV